MHQRVRPPNFRKAILQRLPLDRPLAAQPCEQLACDCDVTFAAFSRFLRAPAGACRVVLSVWLASALGLGLVRAVVRRVGAAGDRELQIALSLGRVVRIAARESEGFV